MRLAAIVVLVACKSAAPPVAAGSGSTKPPPQSLDAAAVVAVDAPVATLVSDDGVGPISARTKPGELVKLFTEPVTSEHEEAEDYSFDRYAIGPKGHPVLEAITSNGGERFFKVTVLGGAYATAEGIAVGSTISDLIAKYPDATCKFEKYAPNAEDFVEALYCTTPKLAHVTFNLDTKGWKTKPGAVPAATIATRTLQKILWVPRRE